MITTIGKPGQAAVVSTTNKIPTSSTNNNNKSTTIPQYVCSPILKTTASHLLQRRLLLPTLLIPSCILIIPSVIISCLSILSYYATSNNGGRSSLSTIIITSFVILLSTFVLMNIGKEIIDKYLPNELIKKQTRNNNKIGLIFWSLVISIVSVRMLLSFGTFFTSSSSTNYEYENGSYEEGGWFYWCFGLVTSTLFWCIKISGSCFGASLGWLIMSVLVVLRYTGPFCPLVRCSSTPLRTNPFDATLQRLGRNFTSKKRFLDMIVDILDKLSAPSTTSKTNTAAMKNNGTQQQQQQKATTEMKITTPFTLTPVNNKTAVTATQNQHQPIILPSTNNNSNNDGLGRLLKFLVASTTSRYSRPGLLSILVQVVLNAVGGHIFARSFVIPHLGCIINIDDIHDTVAVIIVLSCLLVPVFELFSEVNDSELHYSHYSLITTMGSSSTVPAQFQLWPVVVALSKDIVHRLRCVIFGVTMLVPVIATVTILTWVHLGSFVMGEDGLFILESPSYTAIMQSLALSYIAVVLLVTIINIQDVVTRWAVCSPGVDADILMYQTQATKSKSNETFLAEDLIIQSILMGDGMTVDKVIASTKSGSSSMTPFKNPQEDEISRNEAAAASFAEWIQTSSTKCSGKLSDDILRVCLLESFGGGGSSCADGSPFYFGNSRHTAALRKRLSLSAATTSPGQQPIVVPIVRALCAFSGGVGDAMCKIYCQVDKDGKPLKNKKNAAELWKLPPGSLNSVEYAITAAARLVVMNTVMIDKNGGVSVDQSKRHSHLSLLLPCVLQSSYHLTCGVNDYATAIANMYEVNLSTYDKSGKNDGLGAFISTKCPQLIPVLSACNESAKMCLKTLVECGGNSLEEVLLRRKWKFGMKEWLVGLNCDTPVIAQITN